MKDFVLICGATLLGLLTLFIATFVLIFFSKALDLLSKGINKLPKNKDLL